MRPADLEPSPEVSVALREQIAERYFPEWSMGFRALTREESQSMPGFSDHLESRATAREPGGPRAEVFHRAFRMFLPQRPVPATLARARVRHAQDVGSADCRGTRDSVGPAAGSAPQPGASSQEGTR
ncbi:hypothetical protein LQK93_00957 [Terrabacter sp. BE26]